MSRNFIHMLIAILLSIMVSALTTVAMLRSTVRREVNDNLDLREAELVQHYLPRINKLRQELGMQPKNAKTIEELIDAGMEPATNLMQLPKGAE